MKTAELKLELINKMLDKTPFSKESGKRILLTKNMMKLSWDDLYLLARFVAGVK